jgi:hypothetical protein
MGISNLPSSHQCLRECKFILENCSEIETVPDASEFLGITCNIWDINCAMTLSRDIVTIDRVWIDNHIY